MNREKLSKESKLALSVLLKNVKQGELLDPNSYSEKLKQKFTYSHTS